MIDTDTDTDNVACSQTIISIPKAAAICYRNRGEVNWGKKPFVSTHIFKKVSTQAAWPLAEIFYPLRAGRLPFFFKAFGF